MRERIYTEGRSRGNNISHNIIPHTTIIKNKLFYILVLAIILSISPIIY